MNIDCEWLDYDVVSSNDWSKYAPQIVTIEIHKLDLGNIDSNKTYRFMRDSGYKLHSFLFNTAVFLNEKN
jgi:hypothetical protein